MQRCPTCETEYADDLLECPHCGAPAPGAEMSGEAFRCPRCDESYRGSDACPVCGTLRAEVPCERHPDRSAAERCVVCGRAVCDECRSDKNPRAALCEDHQSTMVIEGWGQVYSTANEFEAQLLAGNLRAEGIDSQIYSQRDRAFSVDLGELSIVRLLVPAWEYERALQVIREHMDMGGEVQFACPSCGDAYEPGMRECSSCGAPLP